MSKEEFVIFMNEFLKNFLNQADLNISLDTELESINDWSSMALVASMASIQSQFNLIPNLDLLYASKSIADIYNSYKE